MPAPQQLSLLTKPSALTQCHRDVITLRLLRTRTPSCRAEITLLTIPAGSTGIDSEQVPPERSPGTHRSPRNSICSPPLAAGKDAAAESLGQHSRLLQSSQAASRQRTGSQPSSALPRSQPKKHHRRQPSQNALTPRLTAAGDSSSWPSGGPAPAQGLCAAEGARCLIFPPCLFSPGVALGLGLVSPTAADGVRDGRRTPGLRSLPRTLPSSRRRPQHWQERDVCVYVDMYNICLLIPIMYTESYMQI